MIVSMERNASFLEEVLADVISKQKDEKDTPAEVGKFILVYGSVKALCQQFRRELEL